MAFSKAIVPTDLSEYSLSLQSCVDLYRLMGVRMAHLFHVREGSSPPLTLLHHQMEIMAGTFRGAGMVASTFVEDSGDPTLAILKKAGDVQADLIIMGSHGKGMVRQLLLGSVSHKVLSQWPGSILIERLPLEERKSGGLEKLCQRRASRVLLASRAHSPGAWGCTLLEKLVQGGLQRAHLFTTLELSDFITVYVLDQIPEMRARALESLKEAAKPLTMRGLEVDLEVEVGTMVPSLSKAVAAIQADLAIVEMQGPEDPWEDRVDRLVTRLPCSVLILRPHAKECGGALNGSGS
jgi:nucleotide-binding universal stress UspA family protein